MKTKKIIAIKDSIKLNWDKVKTYECMHTQTSILNLFNQTSKHILIKTEPSLRIRIRLTNLQSKRSKIQ